MKILRPKELAQLLGISITTLWRLRFDLPPKIRIGKTAVGWLESDIIEWVRGRAEE